MEMIFIFLCEGSTIAFSGGDHEVRPEYEGGHLSVPPGEVDDPDPAEQRQEQDDLEARHHFWSFFEILFTLVTFIEKVRLYVPKDSSFFNPAHIFRSRQAHKFNIGCVARRTDL